MISRKNLEIFFFSGVFIGILVLTFFLFKPFLITICLAATIAIVLQPLYKATTKLFGGRKSIASFVTIIISFVFILLPVAFLGEQAFFEARDLYIRFATNNVSEFDVLVKVIEAPIQQLVPSFSININQYAEFVLGWLTDNFKDFIFGTLNVFLDLFLVFIALFFFLRDGGYFVDKLISLSPMKDDYDREVLLKVSETITAVIKGTLFIALIQGFLAGVGLSIFGVPNAVLWGALASLAAFVPGLGTSLVVIPAVIYLFVTGNSPYAFGLSLWGMIMVGTIDNILAPYFFRGKAKTHPLLVLFSVLGGLTFFGPEGFLFGPVIVSVFISFIHIYEDLVLKSIKA